MTIGGALEGLFGPTFLASLPVFVLVAVRVAPLTVWVPWLSLRRASATVRAALIFSLSIAIGLPLATNLATDGSARFVGIDVAFFVVLAMREVIIGTLFALIISLPLLALEWAGMLTDIWRGASLAEVLTPMSGDKTSPLADMLLMTGTAIFIVLDGHIFALEVFNSSFVALPIGEISLPRPVSQRVVVELLADTFSLAAVFAAAAAVSVVFVEISLGLLGRAAPQIPLFFAGMPLRAAAGLGAVLITLPALFQAVPGILQEAIVTADGLLH